jgi:hypothetical protein
MTGRRAYRTEIFPEERKVPRNDRLQTVLAHLREARLLLAHSDRVVPLGLGSLRPAGLGALCIQEDAAEECTSRTRHDLGVRIEHVAVPQPVLARDHSVVADAQRKVAVLPCYDAVPWRTARRGRGLVLGWLGQSTAARVVGAEQAHGYGHAVDLEDCEARLLVVVHPRIDHEYGYSQIWSADVYQNELQTRHLRTGLDTLQPDLLLREHIVLHHVPRDDRQLLHMKEDHPPVRAPIMDDEAEPAQRRAEIFARVVQLRGDPATIACPPAERGRPRPETVYTMVWRVPCRL